jgi:hypothetical protein
LKSSDNVNAIVSAISGSSSTTSNVALAPRPRLLLLVLVLVLVLIDTNCLLPFKKSRPDLG